MTRAGTHRWAAVVASVLLASLLVAPGRASAASTCTGHDVAFRTPLLSGHMHGTLCRPPGNPSAVMVLVPGATYGRSYWDFPYEPDTYSFTQAMNNGGFATFAVDRVGTGRSSRPPSALVTTEVQAAAVHHVIGALRTGRVGGDAYHSVVLGGHSLGSAVVVSESTTYHDADAVLLTGIAHGLGPTVGKVLVSLVPAGLSPVTAAQGYSLLDPGYLTTTTSEARAGAFQSSRVDPGLIAVDEATKSVVSAAEAPTGLLAILGPQSVLIDKPVLMAIGSRDALFCHSQCADSASFGQAEAPFFGPAARLRTSVLPGAGHDLNFDPDAALFHRAVLDWAGTAVGG